MMLKVDNFLGCMKLETGGLVIGWFNAVCDVTAFIFGVILLVLLSVYNCDDLNKAVQADGSPGMDEDTSFLCSFGRGFLIAIAVVMVVFSIGFLIISSLCIKGTHRRDHIYVKPMMILMGVLTVLSLLEILSFTISALVSGLIKSLFYGYQFVVMYSLQNLFQEEFERGVTPQYHAPSGKV